jgi:trehalose 6-phosphate synthase
MGRLVIASNRTASPGQPRAGGLAVALWDALVEWGNGLWFGWSGEITDRDQRGVHMFTENGVDFALSDLTESEHENYYLGYANRTLWPVFHYRVDLAVFDDASFEGYENVNRRFGRLLAQQVKPGDAVWLHDYHFLLMGQEMRQSGWDGPLGFFLHIPFPAPEVFTSLPQHARLARGLCAFDLLGFQTDRDTANFRRYLIQNCDAEEIDSVTLRVFERTIETRSFPIGIDPAEMAEMSVGPAGQAAAQRIGRIIDNRALIIGVDRMDYSKGLPQRMEAFGRMLDDHPEMHGKVSFLQIAPPSREAVDAYQALREELDRLAGRINAEIADLDWQPIRYLARGYPRDALAGLYRQARVGLVTPLYDGMNLVAKEYVAAQDPENPGVLVLSEFAGAAEKMDAAVLVNPHDIGALADAIHRALHMPIEERRERWRALEKGVVTEDIAWWRREFLKALEATPVAGARAS